MPKAPRGPWWAILPKPVRTRLRTMAMPVLKPACGQMVNEAAKKATENMITINNLTPMGVYDPLDVFITAYPKSGMTWFQNLVCGAIHGNNLDLFSYKLMAQLIPEIGVHQYYQRFTTPMFFKSHEMPHPDYRRVVYLLRDGRDVMVSFAHFREGLKRNKTGYWDVVLNREHVEPKYIWHKHVEAWLENPYQADLLLIRYEDLHRQPLVELQRLGAFLGVERETAWLEDVIEKSRFDRMSQREDQYGIHVPKWPSDQKFIRRGKIGSYKDEMPPEVLEVFLKQAGETLQELGYVLD
jgi:hypothetical protein